MTRPLCDNQDPGSTATCTLTPHATTVDHQGSGKTWPEKTCDAHWDKYRLTCTENYDHPVGAPHIDPRWGPWNGALGYDRPVLHDFGPPEAPRGRTHDLGPGDVVVRAVTWQFGVAPALVAYVPGCGDPKSLLHGEGLAGLERELARAMLTTALTRLDEPEPA